MAMRTWWTGAMVTCGAIAMAIAGATVSDGAVGTKGTVDRTFGVSGVARLPVAIAWAGDISIDAHGRLIVSAAAMEKRTRSVVVARYFGDGRLDRSFGQRGIVRVLPAGLGEGPEFERSALMPDGRIVVVSTSVRGKVRVTRLLPNGDLDHSFHTTGFSAALDMTSRSFAIDHLGRVLVVGGDVNGPAVRRLTTGGRIDTSFGTAGVGRLDVGQEVNIWASTIDSAGRVVLAGENMSGSGIGVVARLDSAGKLDTSFGTGGIVTVHEATSFSSVVVEADGHIVAVGSQQRTLHMVAVRLLDNGARDPSFGVNGVAAVPAPRDGSSSWATDGAVESDGTLLLVGSGGHGRQQDSFAIVVHLSRNGRLDPTFGCNGGVWTRFGSGHSRFSSVAIVHGTAFLAGIAYEDYWKSTTVVSRLDLGPSGAGGYSLAAANGDIESFGSAAACPSFGDISRPGSVIGIANTRSGRGDWLVTSDGSILNTGDAGFFGSAQNMRLVRPVVGMAATPSGRGYWLVAGDGGVFSFGDARFFGSMGNVRLAAPVVGMAATRSGRGYWLVASDGGVFSFGDARFFGSMGNVRLAAPVVGMAATYSGPGYWLAAADGGLFSFGDARFAGSAARTRHAGAFVGVASTP